MSTGRRLQIYLPLIGQHDNIGDVILRRELLCWIHDLGDIHAYVGRSTKDYDEALGLTLSDSVYRNAGRWVRNFLASATRRRNVSYIFKPGEIQFEVKGLKEHVGLLPMVGLTRARGGAVVRVGVGSRASRGLASRAVRPSVWLSNKSFWRDDVTRAVFGHGDVIPDLGFGQGMQDEDLLLSNSESRSLLTVSLRSDRPYPPAKWFVAVRNLAGELNLNIVVVTQVARDNERSKQVAEQLNAKCIEWHGGGHWEQEERLRAVYRNSQLALSDRLHVLIAAVTEGAIPVAGAGDQNEKIARHFRSAGFGEIGMDLLANDGYLSSDTVHGLVESREDVMKSVISARETLECCRVQVRAVLEGVRL